MVMRTVNCVTPEPYPFSLCPSSEDSFRSLWKKQHCCEAGNICDYYSTRTDCRGVCVCVCVCGLEEHRQRIYCIHIIMFLGKGKAKNHPSLLDKDMVLSLNVVRDELEPDDPTTKKKSKFTLGEFGSFLDVMNLCGVSKYRGFGGCEKTIRCPCSERTCRGLIVLRRSTSETTSYGYKFRSCYVLRVDKCTSPRCIARRNKYFDDDDQFVGVDEEIRTITNNTTFVGCTSLEEVIAKVLLHIIQVRKVPIVQVCVDKRPETWSSTLRNRSYVLF